MNESNEVKELQNKISILESRINKLEKVNRRKRLAKTISITIRLSIYIIIIYFGYSFYLKVNNYINKYEDTIGKLEEKIKDNKLIDKIINNN